MLKSMGSEPISSVMLRSVKMVPRLGFVSYHAATSWGSVCCSTLHSAQPVFCVSPCRAAFRSLRNTVPEETGVGGVPQKSVCGSRLSVTTYLRALS